MHLLLRRRWLLVTRRREVLLLLTGGEGAHVRILWGRRRMSALSVDKMPPLDEGSADAQGGAGAGWLGVQGCGGGGEQAADGRAARFAAARGRGELWVSELSGHLSKGI